MVTLTLNFHQRITIWMRLGSVNAPSLREAGTFIKILDKIRPKEFEIKDTEYKVIEGGIQYRPPSIDYGLMNLELEDQDANLVRDALMDQKVPIRVDEADWLLKLLDQMKEAQDVCSSSAVSNFGN
jgi:hypothetical protein